MIEEDHPAGEELVHTEGLSLENPQALWRLWLRSVPARQMCLGSFSGCHFLLFGGSDSKCLQRFVKRGRREGKPCVAFHGLHSGILSIFLEVQEVQGLQWLSTHRPLDTDRSGWIWVFHVVCRKSWGGSIISLSLQFLHLYKEMSVSPYEIMMQLLRELWCNA